MKEKTSTRGGSASGRKKQFVHWLSVIVIGIALGLALQFVRAWTEPTTAPPGGNVGAPINTGSQTQTKAGSLSVGSLYSSGQIYAVGDIYAPRICSWLGGWKCLDNIITAPCTCISSVHGGDAGSQGYTQNYRTCPAWGGWWETVSSMIGSVNYGISETGSTYYLCFY